MQPICENQQVPPRTATVVHGGIEPGALAQTRDPYGRQDAAIESFKPSAASAMQTSTAPCLPKVHPAKVHGVQQTPPDELTSG